MNSAHHAIRTITEVSQHPRQRRADPNPVRRQPNPSQPRGPTSDLPPHVLLRCLLIVAEAVAMPRLKRTRAARTREPVAWGTRPKQLRVSAALVRAWYG